MTGDAINERKKQQEGQISGRNYFQTVKWNFFVWYIVITLEKTLMLGNIEGGRRRG